MTQRARGMQGGEKPGLESRACRLGARAVRYACPPIPGRECEGGMKRTRAGALQGRIPRARVGQEASHRRRKGACRKEGQGILVSRGVRRCSPSRLHLPELVTAGHPLPAACWPTHHGQACGGGAGGLITPPRGALRSPASPPLTPDGGGARLREVSSYLGPHVLLNGLTPQ